MSVHIASAVWKISLTSREKIVALKLADHAHDDGSSVRPGVKSVARECGMSTRTIQRIFRKFEERGALVLISEANPAKHRPREYRIIPVKLGPLIGKAPPGDTVSPGDSSVTSPGDTAVSPKPSEQPSLPIPDGIGEIASADPVAMDPAKPLYEVGKELLGKYGVATSTAGGLITKWRKQLPDQEPMAIFMKAGSAQRHDIVAYIQGIIRNGQTQLSGKQAGRGRTETERRREMLEGLRDAERLDPGL